MREPPTTIPIVPRDTILAAPPLPPRFYVRDAVTLARALLGKVLVAQNTAAIVTEVEAYLGAHDPASHAFRGETARNGSMFKPGGTCYVYLSYGTNYCMNVVAGKAGIAEAVLLRAGAPLLGAEAMAARRGIALDGREATLRKLLSGPGKLCQALGIGLADDGRDFFGPALRLVDLGLSPRPRAIAAGPRIGISKAKEEPLRFVIAGSPWLSR